MAIRKHVFPNEKVWLISGKLVSLQEKTIELAISPHSHCVQYWQVMGRAFSIDRSARDQSFGRNPGYPSPIISPKVQDICRTRRRLSLEQLFGGDRIASHKLQKRFDSIRILPAVVFEIGKWRILRRWKPQRSCSRTLTKMKNSVSTGLEPRTSPLFEDQARYLQSSA